MNINICKNKLYEIHKIIFLFIPHRPFTLLSYLKKLFLIRVSKNRNYKRIQYVNFCKKEKRREFQKQSALFGIYNINYFFTMSAENHFFEI